MGKWTGFVWLRIGFRSGLLWARQWTIGINTRQEMSWPASTFLKFREKLPQLNLHMFQICITIQSFSSLRCHLSSELRSRLIALAWRPAIRHASINFAQQGRFYLRTMTNSSLRNVVLIKPRTVDNVQQVCYCNNTSSSQTFRFNYSSNCLNHNYIIFACSAKQESVTGRDKRSIIR
jgi:hypothetical protein